MGFFSSRVTRQRMQWFGIAMLDRLSCIRASPDVPCVLNNEIRADAESSCQDVGAGIDESDTITHTRPTEVPVCQIVSGGAEFR